MIKIALDIMGGDNAPQSNINGAIDFLKKNQGSVKIYMVGNKKYILPELEKNQNISNDTLEIIHTSQIVDPDDKPSKIIKTKPDSSMNKANSSMNNKKGNIYA